MSTLNEFGLIHRFFNQTAPEGYIGVGDDCAVFSVRPGFQLAVSTDTLIEGQHFFSEANPYSLGHKALAVNLSDLSAMGAKPTGCVLALAIPAINTAWLDSFSSGFLDLAKQSGCPLIGGDTTRNPHGIVLTITVFGEVPVAHALRRDRAQPGDDIWLTGTLGGPDLALQYLSGRLALDARRLELCRDTLEHPNPPFAFAPNLLEHAHAAIDISDGFTLYSKQNRAAYIISCSMCAGLLPVFKS